MAMMAKRYVAGALIEFGEQMADLQARLPAPVARSAQLAESDPFAFLVAVLLDQGIPAERAWAAPTMLHDRIGHLDPARLVQQPESVRRAFQTTPKPFRYPRVGADWVVSAARRIMDLYGGDSAAIWAGSPTAHDLRVRLEAFPGIGQKKAAMAVEILARDHGVAVSALEGSDVAYDVHVRRVFLRTGIATADTPRAVIAAARHLHPERPAALDLPAWTIGRHWCRPRRPKCSTCPISWACPSATAAPGQPVRL
jgi:uncharacterized HhH-GPD family protein